MLLPALSLTAQIPGIQTTKPAASPPTPAETPEAAAARLQQWLKEARADFSRITDPDAGTNLPKEIDADELLGYRRDLEQIIIGINRHQKALESMPEATKALQAAREANDAWKGFAEKPPYSMLTLDDLINQRDAVREKAASYQSSLDLFSRTLSGIQDEAKRNDQSSKKVISAAAEDPSADGAANWRLAEDRTKSRLLALRATFLQSNVTLFRTQSEAASLQLSLLDRQIMTVGKKAVLSADDIDKVKKAAEDRQIAIRKEVGGVRKRQLDAIAVRTKMQAVVDQMVKAVPEGAEIEKTPALQLARMRQEAAETRVSVLQFVVESLDTLEQLESYVPDGYRDRKAVLEASSRNQKERALHNLRSSLDRLTAWETVTGNELSGVNANLGEQEARASLISAEDPRLVPINDIRSSLWEKQAVVQRFSQAASAQRKTVQRWLAVLDDRDDKKSFSQQISGAGHATGNMFSGIWNIEVTQYDKTQLIGGVPITTQQGITLGTFIIAIISFLIAYFISTRIKNHVRSMVVRRGRVGEAQAKTLSNWAMIIVSLLLGIITLYFLRIPLTIFTFLGGAIAIGVGFGTQTLIKNLISGVIVLFERNIRVGDIVDIGGLTGSVTEINTRSSILRSGDGKETLVPNSYFLENRVTNLTLSNRKVRRALSVAVAYGSQPQQVAAGLKECIERHGLVLKEPAPVITLDDFGDKALVFVCYYWTEFNDKTNGDVVASDIRFMIEKHFSELGITLAGADQDVRVRMDQPLQLERNRESAP